MSTQAFTREDAAAAGTATLQSAPPWPTPARSWYAVSVFAIVLMLSFVDRQILNLLVEPIKRDLQLTDTQMSLVIGFAFVFFYAFLGLPIARLVDSGTRRTIIATGIVIWSAMTALCGMAANFWQLFLTRVGVGAGEACNGPATFSMMADMFPKEKLPRAIAVLNFGFIAGSGLALIIGGTVIHLLSRVPEVTLPLVGTIASWRLTLIAVGLPGLLVALLLFTVSEPVRRGRLLLADDTAGDATPRLRAVPLKDLGGFLVENRATFGPLFLGLALKTILSFGMQVWVPAFYIRTFGWSAPQVGFIVGLLTLIVAPLGAMFGGILAERLAKKGYDDANMRVVLYSSFLLIPGWIVFPLMPDATLALAVAAVNIFTAMWVVGPQNAALQVITPNQMRGQITALWLFVFNIVGFGLGPTVVALFTDYVFGADAHLRYSMAAASAIVGPLAIIVIWWGLKPYGRSVAQARAWD